ncbi:ACP S-malonyltransferase [Campylobacter hyointestinalis]|uniref:ACP S-malonyltransferase n=1 Tax=Campylobacter hyointestinalis TaxID=198 RepID=UPI000750BD9A|nr:ACP S-malonyltransferase [Campylobacter hyointestinalis]PPB56718.1 malonyl CoA-acyl carrier protein transacylase [Campylobacter hyointestinalis subsp. hyointestinalis]
MMGDVAFLFPGQGSQSFGMGFEIYENFKTAKDLLDSASDFCKIDFKELMFKENDRLSISEFTQPAIVLNSFMCFLAFKENIDSNAKFALGHSLGEFSALSVSGGFDMLNAIKLVHLRGKFMSEACQGKNAGMMVILGLNDDIVKDICEKSSKSVWAANYNCDGQIVVAGVKSDLVELEPVFKEAGAKRAMLLDMSVASHCPLLDSASIKLYDELKYLIKDEFSPVISNVTAKSYTSKADALELLKLQLVKPVLYKQSIKNYENDVDCFIEFGSSVLKGLNKKITSKPTYSISNLSSLEDSLKALA